MHWVLSATIKEMLLRWQGSSLGKTRLCDKQSLYVIFWMIWRDWNRRSLKTKFSVYRLKSNFLCNLWSWSLVHMYQGPMVIDFVNWLGTG